MTESSTLIDAWRDRLTLVKIRFHVLRFRYRGAVASPDGAQSERNGIEGRVPGGTARISFGVTRGAQDGGSHSVRGAPPPMASCLSVPTGSALAPGGVYLDLALPGGVPFVALGGQVAGSRNRYVARRDVAVERWHALVTGSHRRVPGPDADPFRDSPALGSWEDEGGALRRGEGRFRPTPGRLNRAERGVDRAIARPLHTDRTTEDHHAEETP